MSERRLRSFIGGIAAAKSSAVRSETSRSRPKASLILTPALKASWKVRGLISPLSRQEVVFHPEPFFERPIRVTPRAEVMELSANLFRPASRLMREQRKVGMRLGGFCRLGFAGTCGNARICHCVTSLQGWMSPDARRVQPRGCHFDGIQAAGCQLGCQSCETMKIENGATL